MTRPDIAQPTWDLLAAPSDRPAELIDRRTFDGLPPPASRWLSRVVPDDSRLSYGVTLAMEGHIRIGWWMPFTANQVLRAGVGFVWKPIVGGRLLRFVGADILGPDDARMEFRFHGRIPVARASGPDTARSAAGRLAAETVAWVPQATTPQAGAQWTPVDDARAIVTLVAAGREIDVEIGVGSDGRLRSVRLDRWNDSAKPPAHEPFGGDLTDEYRTADGVRIAGSGTIGWGYRTPSWETDQFFRFNLLHAEPI